jgi:hypothetical protein
MPRSVAALLALIVMLCAATAAGDTRRIAVLQPDAELLRAITIALSPWGVDTTRGDVPLPAASQPEAVQTASRLAEQLGVEALVWVTRAEQGSLLWVFDNRRDVTTRALPETPPFDSAAAAAVALSVKTILRSSGVAPLEERRETPSPNLHAVHRVATEIGAGVRWLDENQFDFRLELAALLWFARTRRLGMSLGLSWGPGIPIDARDYRGRYREFAAGVKARLRLFEFRDLSAVFALGGSAHWVTLEGTLGPSADASASASVVNRFNGSVDAQTLLSLHVARTLYLGASLGAAYQPRYQRYLVQEKPIFSPWPLTATLAGYCGVELF